MPAASEEGAAQRAYDAYIAALRAYPSYAPAFTSLGIYYRSLPTPDWDRSSKCFQKAFELDATQEVAARHLAEEFADLSEWSLVEVIARRVVDGNKGRAGMGSTAAARLAWAWKAIGASELNSKRYQQAIVAFQAALRGAPDDVSTWIKLGVAYRHSGKHVAALKVFGRAVAIDPTSWFAKYSIADVQRDLGLLEPAIEAFRQLLAERPDELGVRVVLAETTLAKGLAEQKNGFVVRAEASFIEALREAIAIIKSGTATRVAWKVANDALAGLGKIADAQNPPDSQLVMDSLLDELAREGPEGKIAGITPISIDFLRHVSSSRAEPRYLAMALAVGASMVRVLLETQNEVAVGPAWFDLGVAVSTFRSHLSAFDSSPVSSDEALQQAIRCMKYALHREPLNATFWNALGVLAFDVSPRLSQHCFIRSIEHNSRSAVPWTNLGLFYLVHGDEDLANQAFLRAQVIDPDWTTAWIGQATLADLAGHAVEASVLLDHAFSLPGDMPEVDIAYATRAYQRYQQAAAEIGSTSGGDQEKASAADALSGPLFALSRYLAHRPGDYSALHLYALVLEQLGDLASAGDALEKATALIEQVYEDTESPVVEGQYIIVQTNLGRVRLGARDHQGAVDAFEAALSLLDLESEALEGGLTREQAVTLYTQCRIGTSVALVALGDNGAASEALETAIEDVEPQDITLCGDHLALALSRTHWAERDEDRTLSALLDAPDL
jgi:superkiller protein 3